jgi:hypothetical protein
MKLTKLPRFERGLMNTDLENCISKSKECLEKRQKEIHRIKNCFLKIEENLNLDFSDFEELSSKLNSKISQFDNNELLILNIENINNLNILFDQYKMAIETNRIGFYTTKIDSIEKQVFEHIQRLRGETPLNLREKLINFIFKKITKEKIQIEENGLSVLKK